MLDIVLFWINSVHTKTLTSLKVEISLLDILVVLDNTIVYKTSSYIIIANLITKVNIDQSWHQSLMLISNILLFQIMIPK